MKVPPITIAGLHQFDLRFLELLVLQHLEPAEQRTHLLGRLARLVEARTLAGRCGDARLQLFAPLVERLDALRHRIAHGRAGIDGDDQGRHRQRRHEGGDGDGIEAEWDVGRHHRIRSRN
jgi:hypothetical protein